MLLINSSWGNEITQKITAYDECLLTLITTTETYGSKVSLEELLDKQRVQLGDKMLLSFSHQFNKEGLNYSATDYIEGFLYDSQDLKEVIHQLILGFNKVGIDPNRMIIKKIANLLTQQDSIITGEIEVVHSNTNFQWTNEVFVWTLAYVTLPVTEKGNGCMYTLMIQKY